MRSTTSCTKKHRWSAPSSSFTLGGNRYACSGLYGRNRGISLSASFCLCFSSEFSRTHLKPRPFKAKGSSQRWKALRHPKTVFFANSSGALGIAYLKAADVGFCVVGEVANQILEVAQKGVDVGGVPAAVNHCRRETANEAEIPERGGGLTEHGCGHAVVAVEDGEWSVLVHSNQQHGGVHQIVGQRVAQVAKLA